MTTDRDAKTNGFDPDLGQEIVAPPDPEREEALQALNAAISTDGDLDADGYQRARDALDRLKVGKDAEGNAVHPLVEEMRAGRHPTLTLAMIEAELAERKPLRVETWGGQTEAPRRWLLTDWIPAGRCTILAGPGGLGKSRLMLQLAVGVASGGGEGGLWLFGTKPDELELGAAVRDGAPVVYASWEDEPAEQRRRLAAIYGNTTPWCTPDRLRDLHMVDMVAEGATWGRTGDTFGAPSGLLPAGAKLRGLAERVGARLIVLDAVAAAYAENENDRSRVRAFISSWDGWARDHDCAVVIVAHPPKSGDAFSGSTDWENAARAGLTLTREKVGSPPRGRGVQDDRRVGWKLARLKANYAPGGDSDVYELDVDTKGGLRWQAVGKWPQEGKP